MYGPTGLIAMRQDSVWYYVMKDHLGSTRLVFNKSGTVQSTYDYDAYGKLGRSTISTDIKYRFTGQEYDGETGLNNFRARMYDSDLGMFYATDPAGQTFSSYGYAGNNPQSFVDPTGRSYTGYVNPWVPPTEEQIEAERALNRRLSRPPGANDNITVVLDESSPDYWLQVDAAEEVAKEFGYNVTHDVVVHPDYKMSPDGIKFLKRCGRKSR